MPLPDVKYCIVCEGVRVEERNKATILGFYNILPDVELKMAEFAVGVVPLVFLFGTFNGTGKGNFQLTIQKPDGDVLIKTPELLVTFKEGFSSLNVGVNIELIVPSAGLYTLTLHVSGHKKFQSTFKITHDPSVIP